MTWNGARLDEAALNGRSSLCSWRSGRARCQRSWVSWSGRVDCIPVVRGSARGEWTALVPLRDVEEDKQVAWERLVQLVFTYMVVVTVATPVIVTSTVLVGLFTLLQREATPGMSLKPA